MTLGGGLAIVGELGLVIVATTSQFRRENITLLLGYHYCWFTLLATELGIVGKVTQVYTKLSVYF